MRLAGVAALLLLATGGQGCACTSHERADAPAAGSAESAQIAQRVQRETGTVRVTIYARRVAADADPRAASILVRLGYFRRVAGGALEATTLAKAAATPDSFGEPAFRGDLPIGTQRVDRLTFIDHDDPACNAENAAYDEWGYVSHVTSLNALGRALLGGGLIQRGYVTGYHVAFDRWDGRSALDRVVGINQTVPGLTVDRGQTLGLASSFDYPNYDSH